MKDLSEQQGMYRFPEPFNPLGKVCAGCGVGRLLAVVGRHVCSFSISALRGRERYQCLVFYICFCWERCWIFMKAKELCSGEIVDQDGL